jgi:hypothetical protein
MRGAVMLALSFPLLALLPPAAGLIAPRMAPSLCHRGVDRARDAGSVTDAWLVVPTPSNAVPRVGQPSTANQRTALERGECPPPVGCCGRHVRLGRWLARTLMARQSPPLRLRPEPVGGLRCCCARGGQKKTGGAGAGTGKSRQRERVDAFAFCVCCVCLWLDLQATTVPSTCAPPALACRPVRALAHVGPQTHKEEREQCGYVSSILCVCPCVLLQYCVWCVRRAKGETSDRNAAAARLGARQPASQQQRKDSGEGGGIGEKGDAACSLCRIVCACLRVDWRRAVGASVAGGTNGAEQRQGKGRTEGEGDRAHKGAGTKNTHAHTSVRMCACVPSHCSSCCGAVLRPSKRPALPSRTRRTKEQRTQHTDVRRWSD